MNVDDRGLQIEVTIDTRKDRRVHQRRPSPSPAAASAPRRILRITRLMALAIKFDAMVKRREMRDYADVARLGFVTRARLTQITNLLLLAPEIQEEILTSARLQLLHGDRTSSRPAWRPPWLRASSSAPISRLTSWRQYLPQRSRSDNACRRISASIQGGTPSEWPRVSCARYLPGSMRRRIAGFGTDVRRSTDPLPRA